MTTADLLQQAAGAIAASGSKSPRLDAEVLAAHVLGLDRTDLIARREIEWPPGADRTLEHLLRRRCAGEPVARIIGSKEFWSLPFTISQSVLVPRPETEVLVKAALSWMRSNEASSECRILDLGTGSGCVLLALLHELPQAAGMGIDLDPAAVATARTNAEQLGLDGRVEFCVADWRCPEIFDARLRPFDLIVSNPPYIRSAEIASLDADVSDFDPIVALDGGDDGLDAYRSIFGQLKSACAPDGRAFFECGAGQWQDVISLGKEHGWYPVKIHKDLARIERVIEFCPSASLQ